MHTCGLQDRASSVQAPSLGRFSLCYMYVHSYYSRPGPSPQSADAKRLGTEWTCLNWKSHLTVRIHTHSLTHSIIVQLIWRAKFLTPPKHVLRFIVQYWMACSKIIQQYSIIVIIGYILQCSGCRESKGEGERGGGEFCTINDDFGYDIVSNSLHIILNLVTSTVHNYMAYCGLGIVT